MISLWQLIKRKRRLLITIVLALMVGSILLAASGLLFLEIKRNQTLTLLDPTGPYAIGRVSYDWTDQSRPETYTNQPGAKRELLIWIWYPARHSANAKTLPYFSPAWSALWEQDRGTTNDQLFQNFASIQTHTLDHPPLASSTTKYPVLVFSPGMGLMPGNYTTLIEDLVSHGYIVVGINPTYTAPVAFPDGRTTPALPAAKITESSDPKALNDSMNQTIDVWTKDSRFVLNQLTLLNRSQDMLAGHLDLQHIGLFGHSFGGATAAEVCHLDTRCKAGIDLDGSQAGDVVQTGLKQPFMFVSHDDPGCSTQTCRDFIQTARTILRPVPRGQGYILTIKNTQHFNFTDYAAIFSPLRFINALGSIDGQRGLQITRDYVRAFFDTYLKQNSSPLLQGPSSAYPEVQFDK